VNTIAIVASSTSEFVQIVSIFDMEYFYSSSSDQDSRRERLYWASVVLNDMGIQMIEGMDLEGALDAFRDAIRAFRTGSRISCVQENECNSISFRIEQAEARLRRSHESGPLDLHPFHVVVLDQGTSPQALRVLQYGPSSLIIAPMRLQMRSCRTPPKQEERDVHLAVLLYNMSIVHVCIARLCEDIDDEEEDEGFLHWVKCANLLEKAQSLVETHSMISENMGV